MSRFFAAVASAVVVVLLAGCDSGAEVAVDAASDAPTPLHPAMDGKVKVSSQAPASLPQGSGTRDPHAVAGGGPAVPRSPLRGGEASGGDLAGALARIGLTAEIPGEWVQEPSSSSMRLATLRLPRVDGDSSDGEMSIIHLPGGAGGLDANIRRWEGQFKEKPQAFRRALETSGGVQVTVVEAEGTFDPGGGPAMRSQAAPLTGAMLLGAIAELPQRGGFLFCKAWGPKNTMERWRQEFEDFAASISRL